MDTKSLDQACRQAQWLSKWLSSATGESINVQPVVALPGWYVERKSPNGIPVINPKNFRSVLTLQRYLCFNQLSEPLFSMGQIGSIVFLLNPVYQSDYRVAIKTPYWQ
ncbi:hypothetical protein, partial [Desulfobacterium sp. N47]|uniref:hypothetical protein n=1 Tax=Desulfobacterium sp. N47 TaxID=3115210 RepID=UPI003F4A316E